MTIQGQVIKLGGTVCPVLVIVTSYRFVVFGCLSAHEDGSELCVRCLGPHVRHVHMSVKSRIEVAIYVFRMFKSYV
jgi:hypothetical protein